MTKEIEETKETKKVDGGGLRYNTGKAEVHQVPTSLVNAVAKVLMYGAQKYAKGNYRRGMNWMIPYDCMSRHMMRWLDGEELDKESGLPHLYHAAANVAMLIEYATTCPELDDRFKGKVAGYEDSFDNCEFKSYEVVTHNGLTNEDLENMSTEFVEIEVGDKVRVLETGLTSTLKVGAEVEVDFIVSNFYGHGEKGYRLGKEPGRFHRREQLMIVNKYGKKTK